MLGYIEDARRTRHIHHYRTEHVGLEDGAHLLRPSLPDDARIVVADLRRHSVDFVTQRGYCGVVDGARPDQEALLGHLGQCRWRQWPIARGAPDDGFLAGDRRLLGFEAAGIAIGDRGGAHESAGAAGYAPDSSWTSRPVTGGLNTHIMRISLSAESRWRSLPSSRYILPGPSVNTSPFSRFVSVPVPAVSHTASMWCW
ncbi:Uncharacterised protein [Mycobacteroides abscessus subsp. abscessus]|nr:Uncharacterised protein [Mycobacteroides abscessus subsp. abscessus]